LQDAPAFAPQKTEPRRVSPHYRVKKHKNHSDFAEEMKINEFFQI
jgi:hypothetical protein